MKKVNFKNQLLFAVFIITTGIILRLLPHPPNFAPIGAIALFSGIYLRKKWAVITPLLTVFLSDIFIGFYNLKILVSVYGSFIAIGFIGLYIKKHKNIGNVILGTLLGSTLFFIITNTFVWYFGSMYSNNLIGLFQSYSNAIPFYKYTLLGDLFYVGIFVGSFELWQKLNLIPNKLGFLHKKICTAMDY